MLTINRAHTIHNIPLRQTKENRMLKISIALIRYSKTRHQIYKGAEFPFNCTWHCTKTLYFASILQHQQWLKTNFHNSIVFINTNNNTGNSSQIMLRYVSNLTLTQWLPSFPRRGPYLLFTILKRVTM